jgi:hypothetical protein
MKLPDLSGAITPQDVSTKGTGSYAADYVNWAKVAHIMNTQAPGWMFHLREAPGGGHVWQAPNKTGYLVGYFTSPEGEATADFPQAVMDNRNSPIPFEKISARDVTDTHRRALCAAACFQFSLAYQLWAREPIEDPHQRESVPQPTNGAKPTEPKVISDAQLKRLMAIANENQVTQEQQRQIVTEQFGFTSRKLITVDKYEEIVEAYQSINQAINQEIPY